MTTLGDEAYHFEAGSRLVKLYDSYHQSVLGGFDFNRLQLGDFALKLLLDTAKFRARAISYRGFLVGAGAFAVQGNRFGKTLGYNIKPTAGDEVNIHAEDLVLTKTDKMGFGKIALLCVIGEPQADHQSGLTANTLHPCGRCRPLLNGSKLISKDTLIITAKPDFTIIELSNIDGIKQFHEAGDESGITTYRFEQTPNVLQPITYSENATVDGMSIQEVDDTDWEQTIGLDLKLRYVDRVTTHQK